MKKISVYILILVTIALLLINPRRLSAQTAPCYVNPYSSCVSALVCNPPLIYDGGCAGDISTCTSRVATCVMPSAVCTYNHAFSTCQPAGACVSPEVPDYTCSVHNGDESACSSVSGTFSCHLPGNTPVPPSGPDSGIRGSCAADEINTAIGCISFGNMTSLTSFFLRWGIGIAGGVAFILIVVAGFMKTTSAGDPKRLQASNELMTAALSGLVLLIFSVFVLRVIGFDILRIPGF